MNIVLSSKSFLPLIGGTINYASMLATAFRDAGHEVTIITRTKGKPDSLKGVPIVRCPSWRQRIAIARSADILLQVDSSWQDVLPFLFFRVPWFPTIHRGKNRTSIRQPLLRLKLWLELLAYKLGRTIGVSQFALKSWDIDGLCIESSYDNEIFRLPPEPNIRDIDLFFIGRLTYDKGAFILFESLKTVIEGNSDILKRVYFAGIGPAFDDLAAKCKDVVHVDVRVLGKIETSDEISQLLQRSKILVFPTTSKWLEASPIVPLEALASGCFVIASDIGGTRENIGPNGYLVNPDDPIELAKMIKKVLSSPPVFDVSGAQAFLTPRHVKNTANRYLKLFDSALSNSKIRH